MEQILTDRELATVLAALRFWQQSQTDAPVEDLLVDWPQFAAHRPLLPIEIDALWEHLNANSASRARFGIAAGKWR